MGSENKKERKRRSKRLFLPKLSKLKHVNISMYEKILSLHDPAIVSMYFGEIEERHALFNIKTYCERYFKVRNCGDDTCGSLFAELRKNMSQEERNYLDTAIYYIMEQAYEGLGYRSPDSDKL